MKVYSKVRLRLRGCRDSILHMQEVIRAPEPMSVCCEKCGNQPRPVSSMLDPPTGRTFHMLKCQCGEKTLISLAADIVVRSPPASDRQDHRSR
jgi:hypothetical protein